MHKLTATKYHLDNYERLERQQYEQARRQFKRDPNSTREAFELIFELEAFLFQVKSSLDMLVKLLIPILGKDVVGTRTYKDEGNQLIKGLTRFKNRPGSNADAINALIALIETNRDAWLRTVVQMRDELNHVKGLSDYRFIPVRSPNGDVGVQKPQFRGKETLDFMRFVYQKNLEYPQDFMVFALAVKAWPGLGVGPEDQARVQAVFKCEAAKYVKWCWRMIPPRVTNQA
jgi:hypothetical protein